MDAEILEVLKDIRGEARQTNARLDQTNTRLESLEGRVDFLEKRTSKGFENLSQSIENLMRYQVEVELRLSTELIELSSSTRQIRDLLARRLEDHEMVLNHEQRIARLEERTSERGAE